MENRVSYFIDRKKENIMAYYSEAYDFSLFEPRYDNTAPAREPRREQPEKAPNVVELPKREPEKNARPKRHPIRAMAAVLSFTVFAAIAVAMVYSQEQLAMLTEQINTANQTLEESQSLEVQLNMRAAQKMNGSQVEAYAADQLGMSKISSGQVTYVNVAQKDRGTVVRGTDGGSLIDKVLSGIRAMFA